MCVDFGGEVLGSGRGNPQCLVPSSLSFDLVTIGALVIQKYIYFTVGVYLLGRTISSATLWILLLVSPFRCWFRLGFDVFSEPCLSGAKELVPCLSFLVLDFMALLPHCLCEDVFCFDMVCPTYGASLGVFIHCLCSTRLWVCFLGLHLWFCNGILLVPVLICRACSSFPCSYVLFYIIMMLDFLACFD
jgi:hypothetical protein